MSGQHGKSKEFCFWVVPPKDGRVRKIRVTSRRLLAALAVLLLGFGTVAYIMSDYGRVQVLRAKNFFSLQKVTEERNLLEAERTQLAEEVSVLSDSNAKVIAYEKNLRQRVEELGSLLESADVISALEKKPIISSSKDDGVGGAELNCTGIACSEDFRASLSPTALNLSVERSSTTSLLEIFDSYIAALGQLPLGTPGNGHISSGFGRRISPFTRRWTKHQGVDLSLPSGSQVISTADGVVKSVKRNRTYGIMVDIVHSKKIVTRYAHLSKALVSPGEKICKGEVVGLVGSTGRSTGPHLHYEVRVDGKPQNPMKFINLAKRLADLL